MTGLIEVFLWSEDMIGTAILVFFVGLIALVIGGIAKLNRERAEALAAARMKYRTALDELKNDPTNPNLREATLESGRAYARLCRQGSVAIFDEAALANDIDAARCTCSTPDEHCSFRGCCTDSRLSGHTSAIGRKTYQAKVSPRKA